MKAAGSWWNQGELECFVTRRAVPRGVAFVSALASFLQYYIHTP
jgi:hypothetical protein